MKIESGGVRAVPDPFGRVAPAEVVAELAVFVSQRPWERLELEGADDVVRLADHAHDMCLRMAGFVTGRSRYAPIRNLH